MTQDFDNERDSGNDSSVDTGQGLDLKLASLVNNHSESEKLSQILDLAGAFFRNQVEKEIASSTDAGREKIFKDFEAINDADIQAKYALMQCSSML